MNDEIMMNSMCQYVRAMILRGFLVCVCSLQADVSLPCIYHNCILRLVLQTEHHQRNGAISRRITGIDTGSRSER